jgi:broad specificity phosphatase PhoE
VRGLGVFDARFHSASGLATPAETRVLPKRIILVRHAESMGNVNHEAYTQTPDPLIPLTSRGAMQAYDAGKKIKALMGPGEKVFFYLSPYRRSLLSFETLRKAFKEEEVLGARQEVQLREQDFGNFQDVEGKRREKAERLRFGRFWYRFPNGESGADVYDRMTLFEDHLVRDINAGRFSGDTNIVIVTHGLTLRIFLMRWFHWTVHQMLSVYNPPNAEPLVMERVPQGAADLLGCDPRLVHTKGLFRLAPDSLEHLEGCTRDMCSTCSDEVRMVHRELSSHLRGNDPREAPALRRPTESGDEVLGVP